MPHVTLGDSSEPPAVAQDNKNNVEKLVEDI